MWNYNILPGNAYSKQRMFTVVLTMTALSVPPLYNTPVTPSLTYTNSTSILDNVLCLVTQLQLQHFQLHLSSLNSPSPSLLSLCHPYHFPTINPFPSYLMARECRNYPSTNFQIIELTPTHTHTLLARVRDNFGYNSIINPYIMYEALKLCVL